MTEGVLVLSAAFLYAAASLCLKRGFEEGVGFLRTFFLGNLLMVVTVPFLLRIHAGPVPWDLFYQPLLCGAFFVIGQALTFVAIRSGDVSVVTPTMGSKVVFVALIGYLAFGNELSPLGWVAVFLAGLAVALLGLTRSQNEGRRAVFVSIALAGASCFFFAFYDILVARWAGPFGEGAFVAIAFLVTVVASFGLIPFFPEPLRAIPRGAWFWVITGSAVMAIQALLFNLALTKGEATEANVLYSSRGLWSVVLVVFFGFLFANREGDLPRWMILMRFLGAILVVAAIFLLMYQN